jgi:putative hydrolase of the HAD superfamily
MDVSVQLGSIRAVAFDAVGTLIHPDPPAPEVYAAVGRRFGSRHGAAEIAARFAAAFEAQEQLDIRNGLATDEERERRRWCEIVAQVLDDVNDPAACFAALYEHFASPQVWRCDTGTAAVLGRLRQAGYFVAIASNYDHRLRRVARGLAELAPATHLVISAEAGWRKPAPQFFTHLAGTLELPPGGVLHIGDDLANDFEGARRAGMHALLFDPRGRHRAATDDRIEHLDDLCLPGHS